MHRVELGERNESNGKDLIAGVWFAFGARGENEPNRLRSHIHADQMSERAAEIRLLVKFSHGGVVKRLAVLDVSAGQVPQFVRRLLRFLYEQNLSVAHDGDAHMDEKPRPLWA